MSAAPDAQALAARLTEAGLEPAAVDALLAAGQPFSAPAGTALFRPGDACQGFILLASGTIRVSLIGESGRQTVLYRVRPGQLCLQSFQHLIDGAPYAAEGAAETEVSGAIVPPPAFHRLMGESAPARRLMLSQVAERFGLLLDAVEGAAFRPLDQRLARALLERAAETTAEITHAALAAEIGASREGVSRRLERWAEAGLVRGEGRGRLAITDRAALARLAEGEPLTSR